ncbi:hypothetical protein PHYSODRAFT_343228 [Phytophthora sojae]|uniref:AAA domain-containing protein n=1 Tax=Phytophthora sojae (strain P6497) TaxID=1094619 RepID=G5AJ17_PHYSP|nr:hypothetical protein PHYSODRAFT_343228 [Phytophthora sojae]EGZ04479.1 hypothetical protein PHYSODRAFT_343228 [Phytophthora sojae]|eukprot:XP_009540068.1 hypothetical protein PHYSODRAFT_343228 [Phytophthora sojae]
MSTILGDVRPSQVKIYASPEADVREDQPLDYLVKVNGYGMSEHYPLVVRIAPTGFPGDSTGLARELRHMLKREQLLEGVYDSFRKTPITLLASPRVSGKTTLLRSFARRYPGVNCIYVSFLHDSPATELLLTCGIDFVQRVSRLSVEETHVIMIDDAQAQYDDKAFWDLFACTTISWLPDNARFIISATAMVSSVH